METNKAILTQLIEHGKRVFESLSIPVGTYTAAELVKANQTGKGNARNIWFQYPEGKEKELISVSYGSFKAEFEAQNIWYYIWKFEQLNSVKQAEKARFTKVEKEQGKPVCTFLVDIPKRVAKLKSFVASDKIRPSLCLVALCPSSGSMVATDGIVMRWENVSYHDYTGEVCEYIYINPKDLPNMVGLCSVSVYKDGYTYKTVVTSQTGEIFACACEGRQPNYKRVIPMVSDDGYIRLTKEGVKDLLSLCKIAKKGNKEAQILLRFSSGSDILQVSTIGEEWETDANVCVSLCAPSKFNAVICLSVTKILKVSSGWNGGVWITGYGKPLIFDNDKVDGLDIVSPRFHNDMMCDEIKGDKNALNRFNTIKNECDAPTIKEDVKPSKIEDKEVLPEDKPETEEKNVIPECKEPTKNVPSLYIAPKNVIFGYIELLVLLVYSFRNWLYDYETAKAIARLEYLTKFSLSDDCAVLDIPEEKECLKTDDLECIVSCDVSDDSVCVMSDDKDSPYITSKCTDVVFCAVCFVLVVIRVFVCGFSGASCFSLSRITQRIRDGTKFECMYV